MSSYIGPQIEAFAPQPASLHQVVLVGQDVEIADIGNRAVKRVVCIQQVFGFHQDFGVTEVKRSLPMVVQSGVD